MTLPSLYRGIGLGQQRSAAPATRLHPGCIQAASRSAAPASRLHPPQPQPPQLHQQPQPQPPPLQQQPLPHPQQWLAQPSQSDWGMDQMVSGVRLERSVTKCVSRRHQSRYTYIPLYMCTRTCTCTYTCTCTCTCTKIHLQASAALSALHVTLSHRLLLHSLCAAPPMCSTPYVLPPLCAPLPMCCSPYVLHSLCAAPPMCSTPYVLLHSLCAFSSTGYRGVYHSKCKARPPLHPPCPPPPPPPSPPYQEEPRLDLTYCHEALCCPDLACRGTSLLWRMARRINHLTAES